MANIVTIKGTTYGFSVFLEESAAFDDICSELREKFKTSAKFFGNAQMAISFDGKEISDAQQRMLIEIMEECSQVRIVCIIEHNTEREEVEKIYVENTLLKQAERMAPVMEDTVQTQNSGPDIFHKGSLRSGQVLQCEGNLIILGDVNKGATIVAGGNILVIGALLGNVHAGAAGNDNAFILAFNLNPVQIKINELLAIAPDKEEGKMLWKKEKEKNTEPRIAFLSEGNIFMEPVSKTTLNNIII